MVQAKHFVVVRRGGGGFCRNLRCCMGEKLKPFFGKTERKCRVSCKGTADRKVSEDVVQLQAYITIIFLLL